MDSSWSNTAIRAELGRRLQRERLNRNLTQNELAEMSELSTKTIQNVENGEGSSLATLISMLRSLGLVERFDAFLPDPGLSPIQLSDLRGKTRERASGRRRTGKQPW